ncbi:hypothetical protein DRJ16_04945 [Candidatus Woesearchaeota archaeon]|nr:MAG: hypothetical protein DRJ16_04945 [Candidatus Woesearchaeota archaeon]
MTNSSIVEGVVLISENLASTAIKTLNEGGVWSVMLYVFAFIGFTSLAYSLFNNAWKGMRLVIYGFLFLPSTFIVSLVNKKKRKERLKEWGELKKSLTGKNKIKFWVWLVFRIGMLILLINIVVVMIL